MVRAFFRVGRRFGTGDLEGRVDRLPGRLSVAYRVEPGNTGPFAVDAGQLVKADAAPWRPDDASGSSHGCAVHPVGDRPPARGGPDMEVTMKDTAGIIAKIIVCEHDDATLDLLCEHLSADSFDVMPAPTAGDAVRLCRYAAPDMVLLDLALPDASGLDVIREIRDADGIESRFDPHLPIIVLTGRGGATDRVRGLDLGADDYVQKPFSYEELRGRIAAVLRRRHSRHDGPVRVGALLIDPARHKVHVGDREVHLAKREFTLLRVLASDPTRVFSRDELIRDVWGHRPPSGGLRSLESHASRLRRKLDPEQSRYVVNTWGIGYRLLEG